MKNIYPIALIAILFLNLSAGTLKAQDDKLVNFGVKAGVNYSWLNLEDAEDETGKVGFHGGILARINIAEHFALQGEALYSEKGSRVTYDNILFDGEAKLCLSYIDVPLLMVIKLNDNFNLQAGPYASFLLNANAKNDASIELFDFEEEVDEDFFTSTDFGFAAGIGVEFKQFQTGIRYTHGLQKIEEEKEIDGTSYTFSDAKNSMMQLFIGFVF